MKQFKISRFAYYIAGPVRRAVRAVRRRLRRIADKLTGRWYCAGCKCYHPGRVYAFSLDEYLSDADCGLHIDAALLDQYEVMRGRQRARKLTAEEKNGLRNGTFG